MNVTATGYNRQTPATQNCYPELESWGVKCRHPPVEVIRAKEKKNEETKANNKTQIRRISKEVQYVSPGEAVLFKGT